jgi:hypothetical protein
MRLSTRRFALLVTMSGLGDILVSGLTGPRLSSHVSIVIRRFVPSGASEFLDATANCAADFGQFSGPKDNHDDKQN